MWMWYLNNDFLVLQLLRKDLEKVLMRQVPNTNYMVYMWNVKMKREESIKGERSNERKWSKSREKHYNNQEPNL